MPRCDIDKVQDYWITNPRIYNIVKLCMTKRKCEIVTPATLRDIIIIFQDSVMHSHLDVHYSAILVLHMFGFFNVSNHYFSYNRFFFPSSSHSINFFFVSPNCPFSIILIIFFPLSFFFSFSHNHSLINLIITLVAFYSHHT